MKVICDVHIPLKLVTYLRKKGIQSEHVNNLLNGFYTRDNVIADYADKNKLVVITKDVDFRNGYYIRQSPQKLIRVCLGNISTTELISIFDYRINFLKDTYTNFNRFYIEINQSNVLVLSS